MNKFLAATALWIMVTSCRNKPAAPEQVPETKSFFPIAEYIKGEIKIIDSIPVGILKKTVRGKKVDSIFIERPEFHKLANEFVNAELSKSKLEENYAEHSFLDRTTGYYTFNYEPQKQETPYNRIDVLVKPGETGDKVKSIYFEKMYSQNDTSVNEHFFWKANNSFSIIREKKFKEQPAVVEQLYVIWDPSSY